MISMMLPLGLQRQRLARALPWKQIGLSVVVSLWLMVSVSGIAALWRFSGTPGQPAVARAEWPAGPVRRDLTRPTLVVFLHPQCSCSAATVEELSKLMARLDGRLLVYAFVYRPSAAPIGWERTDIWKAAQRIPGVHMAVDVDAREAERFGAYVSGQALLFDASGHEVFRGGLTYERAHVGDNAGAESVREWVSTGHSAIHETPVFGCYVRTPPATS